MGQIKHKLFLYWGMQNTLLHVSEFQIENAAQFRFAERLEYNDLVDAVNEFRPKCPPCCLDTAARYLFGEPLIGCAQLSLSYHALET